jgi:uncharacterized membrane protein YfcA
MDLAWYIYPLAILAGVVAGIINTLAGSGSAVTLPMLVFMGLSPSVANGTNRVGVIVQNIVGIYTFQQRGKLDSSGSVWFSVPAVLGAIIGARVAVNLDEQTMNYAIGVVMVIILALIILDPKQWLREQSEVAEGRPKLWLLIVFFVIGIYGGFIQAGVGVFLLTALVMGAGYALTHANAVKLVIVLAFSVAAILVFIANDQVNWWLGGLMAIGQSIGAWLAANFASSYPNANVWVRRLLIAVVIFSILKFFGILDLATQAIQ